MSAARRSLAGLMVRLGRACARVRVRVRACVRVCVRARVLACRVPCAACGGGDATSMSENKQTSGFLFHPSWRGGARGGRA